MADSKERLAAFGALSGLAKPNTTKIIMMVMDGLGGLPGPDGRTEMETAKLPNLNRLAAEGVTGMMDPVGPGITPGSGPGHLGLFGYDPLRFVIGRGALSAAGIGFALEPGDVAARFNFCTIDGAGNVTDRRAGRISTEKNLELLPMMRKVKVKGVEIFLEAEKDYRGVLVFRGKGLGHRVSDTDPQATGVPPAAAKGEDAASERTAKIANEFLAGVKKALAKEHPANFINLRGFDTKPDIPTLEEVYHMKSVGIATYPMYRGLAQNVGMTVPTKGIDSFGDELATLKKLWSEFDFFFIHYKYTDSAGEDGDFARKVQKLEEADAAVPKLLELKPDVLVVTGDHSTPATYKGHSWHPVPVVLWSKFARRDAVKAFNETACTAGGLGRMPSKDLMAHMLAHAGRLEKYERNERGEDSMAKVMTKPFEHAWYTVGRTTLIVTQDAQGKPNAMTAGWVLLGGMWSLPVMTIAVRPERYTYDLLEGCGEFTVNVMGKEMQEAVDVCGRESGRDVDKFAKCGMTAVPGKKISVPAIGEALITYECKVILKAESAPITTHRLYFGEILATYADESLPRMPERRDRA